MVEDEEIAAAVRRDPRWLVQYGLAIVLAIVAGGLLLLAFGRLDVGGRVARGFAVVTEAPLPDGGRP